MTGNLFHDDRRGLTKGMSPEQLGKFGIKGLMLMDLEHCRRDSEVIGNDQNLPAIVDWLPEGQERHWLSDLLAPDTRAARLEDMQQCASDGEWHDLGCLLSAWHDDLATLQLLYARWDADAPRRNAQKKRRKTQEPGVSWQRELARYLHAEGPQTRLAKYRHIPQDGREEPLSLCDGKFEITRLKGEGRGGKEADLVRCEFDDARKAEHISFDTFVDYLKEAAR